MSNLKSRLLDRFPLLTVEKEVGGEKVFIKALSAAQTENYQFSRINHKTGEVDFSKVEGAQADLIALCLCEEDGKAIFKTGKEVGDSMPPEFVKEATQTTTADIQRLPGHSFAWPSQRMLPLHTKQDTWLSAAFFHKFGEEMPEGARSEAMVLLKKAAELWDIELPASEDVNKVYKEAGLQHTIRYPLKDPFLCSVNSGDELQKVAEDVMFPGKYPLDIRREVSGQILQAPAEFIENLSIQTISDLQKVAGQGVGTEEAALNAIGQRYQATAHHWQPIGEALTELRTMVKEASTDGLLSHEMTYKTASMIDAIDRFTNLHKRYNSTFRAPECQMFNVTLADYDQFTKLAVQLPSGEWIRKEDLQPVIPFLEESFGHKCASVDEAAEYIRSMPERRSKIVVTHLKNAGTQIL